MPRAPYAFDVSAAVGGPLIVVKFSDGRQESISLSDKRFIRQMLKSDQKLLRLYEDAINELGSAYNVAARRAIDEDAGEAILAVTYQREGIQRKRWVSQVKDEVGGLVSDLRSAGLAPQVNGDPASDDWVEILVPFKSVEDVVTAYDIIDEVVQASPKYWGW